MRIIHVIPTLNMGGAERLTLDICDELAKRKEVSVILIVLSECVQYQTSNNFPIYFCGSKVELSITSRNRYHDNEFQEIVSSFKPNVIHSHLFEAEILVRANPLKHVLYVSHVHDNMKQLYKKYNPENSLKENLTNRFERQWINKRYKYLNNIFVCISDDTQKFITSNVSKALRKNIHKISNAIVSDRFPYLGSRNMECIRLVSIGSFVPKKNQQFLLDVLVELIKIGYKVEMFLLGEGPLLEEVQKKAASLRLLEMITFTGNVKDVNCWLSKANIYVHSAYYEPFGLVLLEAMSTGLPVVCIDGKGNRDIVRNDYNGYMIDKMDSVLMANKIINLMNDDKLYNRLSKNAVQFSSEYDIKQYVDKLVTIYESKLK